MDPVAESLVNKGLTRREIQVVNEVIKGGTNRDVANSLFVTEKTIKFHLTNIYKRLELKNRQMLIMHVYKLQNPEPTKD